MKGIAVAGMAFGDEGKGATVDWLVRLHRSPLVVRYNGGPQAAHNVVEPDGRHHTFAQFGSGTLAGACTHLDREMLVDPLGLYSEAKHLESIGVRDPYSKLTADGGCIVVTPYHQFANRLRESARGANRHGSVGIGVGEAYEQARRSIALTLASLYPWTRDTERILDEIHDELIADLESVKDAAPDYFRALCTPPRNLKALYESVPRIQQMQWRSLLALMPGEQTIVFEGAQGMLLDAEHGYQPPHVSWTDATFNNAKHLARQGKMSLSTVGVFRSYFTRHGAGPFPTEDSTMNHPEPHNDTSEWMGSVRQGRFDFSLAEHATRIAQPDCLVVRHMDRCKAMNLMEGGFLRQVEEATGTRLLGAAWGPTWQDVRYYRDMPPAWEGVSMEEAMPRLEAGE